MGEKELKKFCDLLLYIISKFEIQGVVETKLMKLLYFAEANYYVKNGEIISGVDYFKNFFGPTPDVKILKRAEEKLSKFLSIEKKRYKGKNIRIYKIKNDDYSYSSLTEKEMKEIDLMLELYSDLPSEDLSKISHLDPPYLAVEPRERIDFSYTAYRKSEEDFEEPLSPEDQKKCAASLFKDEDNIAKLFDYAKQISQV